MTDPLASVQRSRAGRDIVVNVYGKVPQSLRGHVRDREFLPLINDRARGFIGRGFVFEELDRQLAGLRSGYVTVLGEPGIGKTALAAHLVATRGWVHHFNIASAGISSHEAFLGNVCAQLVGRFELEVQHLPDHALEDAGFMTGLLDEAARASGEPVVIVVDALDEAAPAQVERGGNRLLLPPVLPEGVFFVVTSREQHDDGLYADEVRQIVIHDDDPRNRADLCALADRELRPEWPAAWDMTKAELVEHLVDRSEGNFQYLRLVLGEMAERDGPVDLPRGLERYYRKHWTAMRAQSEAEYEQLQRPVLLHLATAREAVDVDRLAEWTGLEPRRIDGVLRSWRPFLNVSGEGLYSIYHRSFAEFLEREERLGDFHARVADVALGKAGRSRRDTSK